MGNIIETLCKGFIHTIPQYRKSWYKVVDFCIRYERDTPTYKEHFIKNTQLGTFFYNRFSLGFFGNLWLYVGMKGGWLRTYNLYRDENMKECKRVLEESFEPQLKEMLSKEL